MGAINSVLTGLTTLTAAINTIESAAGTVRNFSLDPDEERRKQLRAQHDLALKRLKQKQNANTRDARERAALEREKMAAQSQATEDKRRAALKRAVARQRASFGGRGIDSANGSAQAVLLGLFDESEDEQQERQRLDTIRNRFIDQDLNAQNRINVLQRSQLKEKQNLARIIEER